MQLVPSDTVFTRDGNVSIPNQEDSDAVVMLANDRSLHFICLLSCSAKTIAHMPLNNVAHISSILMDPFINHWVWLCDSGNHRIIKADIKEFSGTVMFGSDYAEGIPGSTNSIPSLSRFNRPTDIAFDSFGDLYILDADNKCIRQAHRGLAGDDASGNPVPLPNFTHVSTLLGSPTSARIKSYDLSCIESFSLVRTDLGARRDNVLVLIKRPSDLVVVNLVTDTVDELSLPELKEFGPLVSGPSGMVFFTAVLAQGVYKRIYAIDLETQTWYPLAQTLNHDVVGVVRSQPDSFGSVYFLYTSLAISSSQTRFTRHRLSQ